MDYHNINISYLSGKTIDEVISELTRLKIEHSTKTVIVLIPEYINQNIYQTPNYLDPYGFGI